MATPHVAALAGLAAMTTPTLSATALVPRIQQSASSSDSNGGWDESFGYGVIDAYNALAGNLRSSTLGSIVGQVIDPSGLPVTNAQVFAAGLSILTDSSGLFRFANTPAGHYTLT